MSAMNKICIYDKLTLFNGQSGEVHFMGAIADHDGIFYGIKLHKPNGENNGTVNGMKYFECDQNCGIFVQEAKIKQSAATNSNSELPRISIEDRVFVKSKYQHGTLLFVGSVDFEQECVYGVELEEPLGDNDGSVGGRQYFHGMAHYGVFCKAADIAMEQNEPNVLFLENDISVMNLHKKNDNANNGTPVPHNVNNGNVTHSTNSTYSDTNSPLRHVAFNEDGKEDKSSYDKMENFADVDSEYPQIGKTIVIDGGTYSTRIGICGEKEPTLVMDTVDDWTVIKSQKQQPLIYGTINKWKYIEQLWLSCIEEKLQFDSTEHPLILTETHDISKGDREKLTQMLFEQIQCPAFYVSPSSLFSLYSTGRTSGCVLDFAYDCTRIVPIYEGYVLQLNAATIQIGGQHISSQLALNLEKNSKVSQIKSFDMNVLEDIKRKHCVCVALDDGGKVNNIKYKLPDGQEITITSKEAIQPTEILFRKTDLINTVYSNIMKCDKQSYSDMFNNVIVCGGTSLLKGINNKIKIELNEVIKENKETATQILHVANPTHPQLSAWVGASIFSSLGSFDRALVTIQEYQECGARIVNHKCF